MIRKPGTGSDVLETLDARWYARLFDYLGARYDELAFTRGTAQEVAFLVAELGLEAPARVLDVGCGTARHAIELASAGFSVTGVDLSLRMLEVGLSNAKSRDAIVNLMHADVRELPFEAAFDVVLSLCEGAFGLLEDDQENRLVLASMRKVLRPGGAIALNALHRAHFQARADEFPGFDAETGYTVHTESMTLESGRTLDVRYRDRSFSPAELTGELEQAGFEVTAIYGCAPGDFGRHPVASSFPELLLLGRAR